MRDMSLILLIERAGAIVGSEYQLAKKLEVTHQRITAWKSGQQICTPSDRARIASFAHADPIKELVSATISQSKGKKREQLEFALSGW